MRIAALALLLLATACGGTTDPASSSSSGASGSSGATPTTAGSELIGIYHLARVDATNLEVRADGTYQWSIEGCDFGGGQCGTWQTNAAGAIVLQNESTSGLEWVHDGSFKARLNTLYVKKSGDDVTVVGETTDGKRFEQSWQKGRSCAVCGGQLGPTGQEACSVPLPKVCGG